MIAAGPLVAPRGGFQLDDIWRAYAAGVRDGKAYPTCDDSLIDRSADAYVKLVAVPLSLDETVMPKRDGHIPTDAELDALAEITDDDIDDAVRSGKQRAPKMARAFDAVRDDSAGGVSGPIPDEQ